MSQNEDPEKGLPLSSQDTAESGQHPSISSVHSETSDASHHLQTKESLPSGEAIVAGAIVDGRPAADAQIEPAQLSRSRASSVVSRPLTIIPPHKRRGLFSRFTVVPEVARPYDYKNSTKWGITLTIAIATAAAPLGSSIFYRMSHTIQAWSGLLTTAQLRFPSWLVN